jgi:hypothetical protein
MTDKSQPKEVLESFNSRDANSQVKMKYYEEMSKIPGYNSKQITTRRDDILAKIEGSRKEDIKISEETKAIKIKPIEEMSDNYAYAYDPSVEPAPKEKGVYDENKGGFVSPEGSQEKKNEGAVVPVVMALAEKEREENAKLALPKREEMAKIKGVTTPTTGLFENYKYVILGGLVIGIGAIWYFNK